MPSDDQFAVFDGRYSDGRTAQSHRVRVHLTSAALVVAQGEAIAPLAWPLRSLETAEPLTPGAIDVLVHEPGRAGATVFVAEGAFVRLLAQRAPHLTARIQRWRYAKPWLAVTALVAAVVALVTLTDFSPARSVASLMPRETRVAIGRQVIRSMGAPACDGTEGRAALAVLAKRLSDASGAKKTFDVSVIDSPQVNAFAAPGEEIVIMRRLLDRAESADEVAGVLAHEMGHGIELHPETGIVRAVGLMALTEFMLGGSGGTLANMGLYLTQLGYSRQAEREADTHALAILKSAGISTRGITDFFHRMEKITGEKDGTKGSTIGGAMDILRTHPSTAERVARFERATTYPTTPALTADQWRALKGICGAPMVKLPQKRSDPGATTQPKSAPRVPSTPKPPRGQADTQRDI